MAKATSLVKKRSRTDLENLSQKDKDILTLETKDVMKKYKLEKQGVYDRRFALNKKIKATGLSVEQVLGNTGKTETPPKKVNLKKAAAKAGKVKAQAEKADNAAEEKLSDSREVMVVNKQVPVIMKPIEINFDNFSIKLNGVPKKISVNPDTHAIEIDL